MRTLRTFQKREFNAKLISLSLSPDSLFTLIFRTDANRPKQNMITAYLLLFIESLNNIDYATISNLR
jgi:hypothetical protein